MIKRDDATDAFETATSCRPLHEEELNFSLLDLYG